MTGTLLNISAVLIGGSLGLAFGQRLPDRVRSTLLSAIGLFTIALGISMFLETTNALITLASLLVGGLLGEWWRLEDGLASIGSKLEARYASAPSEEGGGSLFVRGFLSASLLFCVGPLTILGSIQDGLTGDYSLLAIKSMLDGFASIALASTLGVGVLFSVLVVLVYQGGLSLLASQAQGVLTDPMIGEMTAAGGILILALGVGTLLELRPIRTGNLLPALGIAPLIVWLISAFD